VSGGTAGQSDYGTPLQRPSSTGIPRCVNRLGRGDRTTAPATQRGTPGWQRDQRVFSRPPLPTASISDLRRGADVPSSTAPGTAVWEVLSDDPLALENFDMPVWFHRQRACRPGPGVVSGSLGSQPPRRALSMRPTAPRRRAAAIRCRVFVDTPSATVNVVQVTAGRGDFSQPPHRCRFTVSGRHAAAHGRCSLWRCRSQAQARR